MSIVAFVRATETAAGYAERYQKCAEALRTDADCDARSRKRECRTCFYLEGRAGCASVTHQPCGLCGADQCYHSTCTDVLCAECADAHNLCKHCGGDREMRVRRRKWPAVLP